ncbi:hypothetical protein IR083_24435, partial [Dysgonomonas sp. GY75]|nr:hypothetical protein [Dysgonomonas sp. GY75]
AVPADTVYIPCVDKQYRHESGSACILFPVDRYVVYPDYGNNRQELSKIQRSVETVLQLPGSRIESISLEAYASPEGELSHNISLSEKRAAALRDYMVAAYGFDAGCFTVRSKGENWDGLRAAVIAADALGDEEKADILHILGEQDAPARKARLKAYRGGKPYAYLLGEVYPSLRVCEYRISYTVNSEQHTNPALRIKIMKKRPGCLPCVSFCSPGRSLQWCFEPHEQHGLNHRR